MCKVMFTNRLKDVVEDLVEESVLPAMVLRLCSCAKSKLVKTSKFNRSEIVQTEECKLSTIPEETVEVVPFTDDRPRCASDSEGK